MKILEKIDKLRMQKGWTFYKLAEESALPLSTITNLFVRKSQPSLNTLIAICKGLNISLSQFFAESDSDIQTEQERELLTTFKQLNSKNKSVAIKIIKLLNDADISLLSQAI